MTLTLIDRKLRRHIRCLEHKRTYSSLKSHRSHLRSVQTPMRRQCPSAATTRQQAHPSAAQANRNRRVQARARTMPMLPCRKRQNSKRLHCRVRQLLLPARTTLTLARKCTRGDGRRSQTPIGKLSLPLLERRRGNWPRRRSLVLVARVAIEVDRVAIDEQAGFGWPFTPQLLTTVNACSNHEIKMPM